MKSKPEQKTFKRKKCKTGKRAPGKRAAPALLSNDRFAWNDDDIEIVILPESTPPATKPQ